MSESIIDRCPSCGARSLFIGSGGWLTCSVIGCKEPGVTRALEQLQAERDAARALADRLAEALEDAAWYHDKDFPDRTCTSCYDWASALAAYKER